MRSDCDAIKQATDGYIASRFRDAEEYYTNALHDVQDRKPKLDQLRRRKSSERTPEQNPNPES